MSRNLKIYVGYDSREDIAFQVCQHSLLRHTAAPLAVHPIKQDTVRELGLYTRPVDANASTEFSLTRFLTPYLGAQEGWTIFVDCDFVFTVDVRTLLESLDPVALVLDFGDVVQQRRVLSGMLELHHANPPPVRQRPRSAAWRRVLSIAQQVLAEPVLGA